MAGGGSAVVNGNNGVLRSMHGRTYVASSKTRAGRAHGAINAALRNVTLCDWGSWLIVDRWCVGMHANSFVLSSATHGMSFETQKFRSRFLSQSQKIPVSLSHLLHMQAKAEEAASLPPPMARLSVSPSSSNGSGPARTPGGGGGGGDGGESDVFEDVDDDTEMALQNTITKIERLILSSRKVKNLPPGAVVSAATIAAREAGGPSDSSGGEGDGGGAGGGGGGGLSGGSDVDGATSGGRGVRTRIPPKIDRAALLSRRQSTSFFDTKPVFSARDSSSSFTKMWNAGGTPGSGGSRGGAGSLEGTRPMTARAGHSRRQTEKWGWRGEVGGEDIVVGTPPTVEGSAGSSIESPSNG